jgi:hypothetical protein
MKKLYSLLFVGLFFCYSCDSKEEVGYYFSDSERDTLLTNIITYISENARFATDSTKFQSKYRAEYVSRLPLFHFVHLSKDTAGNFIYLISRPVAGRKDLRRGVVGKFTLKEGSLLPENFEEVVNTPHFTEELVVERGSFLFKELVKKGNLTEYLAMKHYVEWPDKYLVYDKKKKTWVSTGVL